MLVVIGGPGGEVGAAGVRATGLAMDVARAAVAAGAAVQVVARVGDDAAGDAVLLDLAGAGVGHVAVLRGIGLPTPVQSRLETNDELVLGTALEAEGDPGAREPEDADAGLPIDADDLELALRYLPDYRVVVVASELDPASWATAVAAAEWAGAALVGVVRTGTQVPDLPADATVLERPSDDADGTFASMVGRYAAGLDAGEDPAAAFAAASSGSGWASVAD